jgi:hypothetical protein
VCVVVVLKKKLTEVPADTDISLLPPRGLRILQAAKYSGTTSWFLRRAIWDGKLTARQCGRFQIILKEDLDSFLESLSPVEPNKADWLQERRKAAA